MPDENLYRRFGGWLAIVTIDAGGCRLILRRTERCLEDALDIANEVLTNQQEK